MITIEYGFMRGADQFEPDPATRAKGIATADRLGVARYWSNLLETQLWTDARIYVNQHPQPGGVLSAPQPDEWVGAPHPTRAGVLIRSIRALKAIIRDDVAARRAAHLALPLDADRWWRDWETVQADAWALAIAPTPNSAFVLRNPDGRVPVVSIAAG